MAKTLKISQEHVKFISHDELDMQKLVVKRVPKCLNANQKCDQVLASQAILEHFRENTARFLPPLVTMDETWIHLYDPETKEQSKGCRHRSSAHPKKFWKIFWKSASKVMASVFWDKDGILLVYFKEGATITAGYYTSLLDKVHPKWWGKLLKGVVPPGQCLLTQGWHHTPKVGWSALWSAEIPYLFTWSGPLRLPIVPKLWKTSAGDEIFYQWGCHVCSIWMIYRPTFSFLPG